MGEPYRCPALPLYRKAHTIEVHGEIVPFISPKGCTQQQVQNAVYDLTRADRREASPARCELTAEARKACFGLLGPAPEHPMRDFLRYGPPDIMGEANIKRWQEEFRKRKAAEADKAADGEAPAEPEKKSKRRRGR